VLASKQRSSSVPSRRRAQAASSSAQNSQDDLYDVYPPSLSRAPRVAVDMEQPTDQYGSQRSSAVRPQTEKDRMLLMREAHRMQRKGVNYTPGPPPLSLPPSTSGRIAAAPLPEQNRNVAYNDDDGFSQLDELEDW
jgi:hypothetical protein